MGRMSNQHAEVMKIIKKGFPHYRQEVEHHLGKRLFLDIYMPEISIGVEINGRQHYVFIPHFHGTEVGFEEYKMRDRKKAGLCVEQGIGLYTVRYDEEFDINDFSAFIIQHLQEQGS